MNRRRFIQKNIIGTSLFLAGGYPLDLSAQEEYEQITILHTNDTHSHIEPFPDNHSKYAGMGGIDNRYHIIEEIRKTNKHLLLLDAGDIFQGTPYFNFFNGEVEMKAMSAMGYDAATIGNHDFDAGIENLSKQLGIASFTMLNNNYTIDDSPLHKIVKPYTIIKKGKIKIGITGTGVALEGLVPKHLYGNLVYENPIEKSNYYAKILKLDLGCDYVICLSHLGYQYSTSKVSDRVLAENSENINLIIGGHTHTFLETPEIIKNKKGENTFVTQAGWAGLQIGKINLLFHKKNKKNLLFSDTVKVRKKTIQI